MISFHGNKEIKDKYVSRVVAHQKADNLVRGTSWIRGKGCAVGCTLEKYDHKYYEIELGIPEWLAHVEDKLFEKMSLDKSKTWPEEFLKAIPLGVDLDQVKATFLIMVLEYSLKSFDNDKYKEVTEVINKVISLYKNGGTKEEFRATANEAYAVAYASSYAAYYTEAYAAIYGASYTAYYASSYAASYVAEYAAYSAESAASKEAFSYDYFADELLKMMKGLK